MGLVRRLPFLPVASVRDLEEEDCVYLKKHLTMGTTLGNCVLGVLLVKLSILLTISYVDISVKRKLFLVLQLPLEDKG